MGEPGVRRIVLIFVVADDLNPDTKDDTDLGFMRCFGGELAAMHGRGEHIGCFWCE
jgi:hypothetical protein